jgi:hypothetical protein
MGAIELNAALTRRYQTRTVSEYLLDVFNNWNIKMKVGLPPLGKNIL